MRHQHHEKQGQQGTCLVASAVGASATMTPPETQSDATQESHASKSSHVTALLYYEEPQASREPGSSAQLANVLRCRWLRKLLHLRRQNMGFVWNKRVDMQGRTYETGTRGRWVHSSRNCILKIWSPHPGRGWMSVRHWVAVARIACL